MSYTIQAITEQVQEIIFIENNFLGAVNNFCQLIEEGYSNSQSHDAFLDFHTSLNLAVNVCGVYSDQLESLIDITQDMLHNKLQEDIAYDPERKEIERIEQAYRSIRTGIESAVESLQHLTEAK